MKALSCDEMVGAMLADDARYNGRFFVCVRTTRIYCLPSCTARDPKLENVLFFRTREEAVAAGFRGCKRCLSESYPDVTPPWVYALLNTMRSQYQVRLKEIDLVKVAGVDASTIRRHFRLHLDTTPMAFYRRLRLERARHLMEKGADPLTAAIECGFQSESGFREALKRHYGTKTVIGR